MKVPKYIKEAIKKCGYYNNRANKNEKIVRKWLNKNKLSEETCEYIQCDMIDSFIDSCIYQNKLESSIKQLESLGD